MKQRTLYSIISLVAVLSILMAACAAPAPQTIIETVVVTEIVEGKPVEKVIEKVVTPTPLPPTAAPAAHVPQPVDTVVFGMQQEPDTLHAWLSTMSASFFVLYPVRPGCTLQNEKTEWVPLGCESLPTLENGGMVITGDGEDKHLEVTFKIRKDWRWTDGTPVTAKDVIYWWKLNMDPNFESQSRSTIEKIYEISAVDDKTVLVKYMTAKQIRDAVAGTLTGLVDFAAFKEDYVANFTADWKDYAVEPNVYVNFDWLPAHVLESIPAADQAASDYARLPLGDGAYVVKEWRAGQEVTLEKSDQPFPLGDPKIKTIIFRFYGDGAAIKAALQSGEIDAALGTISGLTEKDGPDLDAIEAEGRYKVEWVPQYNYEHIDLNVQKFPLDDVLVRQALMYGIDRQAINDAQYFGKKAITDLPLAKGLSWAYPPDSELVVYEYNPDKALELLAQAGWDCSANPCTKEVDGQVRNLEFTFMTTDRLDRMAVAQMIQAMWKKINVGVNLQFLYGRGLFSNCSAGGPLYCRTYDAAMYAFSTGDDATFYTTYSCGAIPNEGNNYSGQNTPGWCNQAANDALNQSENNPENALSREKRMPYLTTFFREMTKDMPVIFLYGAAWPYPHLTEWKNFKAGLTQYAYPTWNPWEWEVSK
jgi:peptide/nickel transport system substrate-binding protein